MGLINKEWMNTYQEGLLEFLQSIQARLTTKINSKLNIGDIRAWAKASNKPNYNLSELTGTVSQQQLSNFINNYLIPGYFTKDQINNLIVGLEQFEPVRVSTLPTASADTMHKMYFAPTGTGGTYEVYITAKDGNTYQHVKLNLSNTYTKEEIDTLMSTFSKTPIVSKTASDTTAIIEANKLYLWTEPVATLSVSFMPETVGIVNEYMIQFTCPNNRATDFTLPDDVRWANDNPIEPEAGFTYQISIVNNLAVFAGWEAASNE